MKINNILSSVETFDIVLPQFQREYVWSKEDAKQLMVSFYKNYPTGSLLFWKASGENIPELKGINVDSDNIGFINVILDGQQRITTLFLLIKGEIPPYYAEHDITNDPRNLYFNLETGEFQYFMKTKMQDNPLWQKVTDCFDSSKVNAVSITIDYGKKVNEGIENWGNDSLDTDLLSRVNDNLIRLQNIRNTEYHIQIVPSEARIDEAIDVFDRVNSKGTKLTDAELVLTHITGKWPDARIVIKEKIQKLENVEYYLDLDFFTRCMVIALTGSALLKKNAKLDYNKFTKDDYIKAWDKISNSTDYLVPILKHEGLYTSTDDMSTKNVLIPMIAYLLKNERFTESMKYGFLYWMNLAQIWSRYSGQTNERLDKDVYHVSTSSTAIEDMVREIEDIRGRIEVKPADLEGRGANHPLYRMLYIFTKHNKAIDWANGSPIQGVIGDIYSIQSHHIFPQNFLYNNGYDNQNHLHKKMVNEIANRAFITRDSNFKISDKDPLVYLPKVEEEYPGSLEKQFIPQNRQLWKIENYSAFLRDRRKIIADEINDYLQELNEKYLGEKRNGNKDWFEVIEKGENDYIEFKESLRWDYQSKEELKKSEYIALRALASFLNSGGGILLIGVADDGNIKGIEKDYKTFNPNRIKQDSDGFKLHLDNLIKQYLGDVYHTYISIDVQSLNGNEICIIEVSPSDGPVYLKSKDQSGTKREEFFIRRSASSIALGLRESHEYIKIKWND